MALISMGDDIPGGDSIAPGGDDSLVISDSRFKSLGLKKIHFEPQKIIFDAHENQYKIWRYMFGIGEGFELVNRIPMECNLDLLGYISFSKGCYIGQELVARTKYKVTPIIYYAEHEQYERSNLSRTVHFALLQGVVRKRLVPFMTIPPLKVKEMPNFSPLCELRRQLLKDLINKGGRHPEAISFDELSSESIKEGRCKVFNAENKHIGEVIGADYNGVIGLAIIRLEDLKCASQLRVIMSSDNTNNISDAESSGVPIYPFRPDWWPDKDPLTGLDIFDGL
jgi:folate-binding protein YgfZ